MTYHSKLLFIAVMHEGVENGICLKAWNHVHVKKITKPTKTMLLLYDILIHLSVCMHNNIIILINSTLVFVYVQ